MSTTTVRLWLIRENTNPKGELTACLYSKIPLERNPATEDTVWIPASVIEHRTKAGQEHMIKLPDWFIDSRKL